MTPVSPPSLCDVMPRVGDSATRATVPPVVGDVVTWCHPWWVPRAGAHVGAVLRVCHVRVWVCLPHATHTTTDLRQDDDDD